jgi:hypothetical protein
MTRTYSRADWDRAEALWGDFSPEWDTVRKVARQHGILFPPSGTKWDSWEDDSPSQRAILIRAIRETPAALGIAIASSSTWTEVIERLIGQRDQMRAATRQAEQDEPPRPGRAALPETFRDVLRRAMDAE